ncbi:hypothetical protein XPA_001101 [Xanthoria parietina]
MDDPRNSHETMIQSTEPSGPNGHPGDRGTQADPDPPSQQSSPPIDYELDYQPVYNVKEEKLTPGGPAVTVDGVKYSLDASATALLSDSQTIPLGSPTKLIPSLIIDQQTLSADSAFVYRIGGQNLNPGGPAIAISGTSYSLAASATALLVGSSTVPLGSARPAPPPIPINGEIYTADTRPRLKFKGSEIVAGGAPVTINDVPYALDLSATALYIGSRTIAVSSLMQQQQQQPSGQSQPADEGGLAPAIIGSSTTPTAKQKPPNNHKHQLNPLHRQRRLRLHHRHPNPRTGPPRHHNQLNPVLPPSTPSSILLLLLLLLHTPRPSNPSRHNRQRNPLHLPPKHPLHHRLAGPAPQRHHHRRRRNANLQRTAASTSSARRRWWRRRVPCPLSPVI